MHVLRQSTAVTLFIGPFLDSTNGNDEETGLSIPQASVRLSKNGAASAQKDDATAATHDANGMYRCALSTTDTDTVGRLVLYVHVSGALFVRHDYQVKEEAIFDAYYAASATGITAADNNFDPATDTVANVTTVATLTGHTAQTGDSFARLGAPAGASVSADIADLDADVAALNDVSTADLATALTDIGLDHLVSTAVAGTDVADDSIVAQLVSSSATADFDTFDNTTDSLEALAVTMPGEAPSAATIADAVWDEGQAGHNNAGSFGEAVTNVESDTSAILTDTGTTIPGTITTLQSDVTAVLADTAAIQPTVAANLDAAVSTRSTPAQVNTQLVDVLETDTHSVLSSLPDSTGTILQMIQFIVEWIQNDKSQTSSTYTLRNAGDSGDLGTATVSDSAGTFTKGKLT